jgi:hypothetical protein
MAALWFGQDFKEWRKTVLILQRSEHRMVYSEIISIWIWSSFRWRQKGYLQFCLVKWNKVHLLSTQSNEKFWLAEINPRAQRSYSNKKNKVPSTGSLKWPQITRCFCILFYNVRNCEKNFCNEQTWNLAPAVNLTINWPKCVGREGE